MSNIEAGEKEIPNGVQKAHLDYIRKSPIIPNNTDLIRIGLLDSLVADWEKKKTTNNTQRSLASLKASLTYFG